jgi:hypothetical protein
MKTSLFDDECRREPMQDLIKRVFKFLEVKRELLPDKAWDRCMRSIAKQPNLGEKQKRSTKQVKGKVLKADLAKAQIFHGCDPDCKVTQEALKEKEQEVHAIDDEKATWIGEVY